MVSYRHSINIIYLFTCLYYYEIVHEILQSINSFASDAEYSQSQRKVARAKHRTYMKRNVLNRHGVLCFVWSLNVIPVSVRRLAVLSLLLSLLLTTIIRIVVWATFSYNRLIWMCALYHARWVIQP